jgi:hypothetical protein
LLWPVLGGVGALIDGHPDEAPRAQFERFKRTLVGEHGAAQRRLHQGAAVTEVLGDLGRARARVGDWHLEQEDLDALAPGFKRIYRRGRRAYRSARQEPAPRTCTSYPSAQRTSGMRRRSSDRPRRRR